MHEGWQMQQLDPWAASRLQFTSLAASRHHKMVVEEHRTYPSFNFDSRSTPPKACIKFPSNSELKLTSSKCKCEYQEPYGCIVNVIPLKNCKSYLQKGWITEIDRKSGKTQLKLCLKTNPSIGYGIMFSFFQNLWSFWRLMMRHFSGLSWHFETFKIASFMLHSSEQVASFISCQTYFARWIQKMWMTELGWAHCKTVRLCVCEKCLIQSTLKSVHSVSGNGIRKWLLMNRERETEEERERKICCKFSTVTISETVETFSSLLVAISKLLHRKAFNFHQLRGRKRKSAKLCVCIISHESCHTN